MRNSSHLLALSVFALSFIIASAAFAETTGQYVDDATITAKIKTALTTSTILKQSDVSVTTTQGIVQLSGVVVNKEQETEAMNLANHADGVKSVTDLLHVKSTQGE